MSRINFIQNSFLGGEFSPRILGRTDLPRYPHSAQELNNVIVQPFGGASSRNGTKFFEQINLNSETRLIPFTPNDDESYVVVVSIIAGERGSVEIINTETLFKSTVNNGSLSIDVSLDANTDLDKMQYAQAGERMIITFDDFEPRVIERLAVDSFSVTQFSTNTFSNFGANVSIVDRLGYTKNRDDALNLRNSATSGAMTIFAEDSSGTRTGFFRESHKAAYFRLNSGYVQLDLVTVFSTSLTGTVEVSSSDLKTVTGTGTLFTTELFAGEGITIGGEERIIDTIASDTSLTVVKEYSSAKAALSVPTKTLSGNATASSVETLSVTTRTNDFEESWSDAAGWPRTVSFFSNRLYFGGSFISPDTLWNSETGNFAKISELDKGSIEASDPLDLGRGITIAASKANKIQWISGGKSLTIGTLGDEYIASDIADSTAAQNITPQTSHGSAFIQAVQIDDSLFFVDKTRRHGREFSFDFSADNFRAVNLSIIGEHLFDKFANTNSLLSTGIRFFALQESPSQVLWFIDREGGLFALTREKTQDIAAWHSHTIGGVSDANGTPTKVESVIAIPVKDETHEQIWMVVNRFTNGTNKRFIEHIGSDFRRTTLDSNRDSEIFSDSARRLSPSPTLTGTVEVAIADLSKVVGTGTLFTTELAVGDAITIDGEQREITSIVDATNLFVTAVFTGAKPAASAYTRTASKFIREANLSNLAGETVQVNADGFYVGDFVITNPANLTGTVEVSILTPTRVDGTGTLFTTELAVGDFIQLNGLEREVASITNDTELFVTASFDTGQPSTVYSKASTLTLNEIATDIIVGLQFDCQIKTQRLDRGSAIGSNQGLIQRVDQAVIRFYDTVGAEFGHVNSALEDIDFRGVTPLGTPIPPFTGDKKVLIPNVGADIGDQEQQGVIVIKQTKPLPLNVAAVVLRAMVNEI